MYVSCNGFGCIVLFVRGGCRVGGDVFMSRVYVVCRRE